MELSVPTSSLHWWELDKALRGERARVRVPWRQGRCATTRRMYGTGVAMGAVRAVWASFGAPHWSGTRHCVAEERKSTECVGPRRALERRHTDERRPHSIVGGCALRCARNVLPECHTVNCRTHAHAQVRTDNSARARHLLEDKWKKKPH